MKKALTRMACVCGLLTFMFVPTRAANNPAVVIRGQACAMLDGDGGLAAGDSITVTTSSGVTTIMCKAKKVPNDQQQSLYFGYENTGYTCGTVLGETSDWKEHISASGNATLACHFKN